MIQRKRPYQPFRNSIYIYIFHTRFISKNYSLIKSGKKPRFTRDLKVSKIKKKAAKKEFLFPSYNKLVTIHANHQTFLLPTKEKKKREKNFILYNISG